MFLQISLVLFSNTIMKLHGIVPMLETEDLPATISFYRDILGFEPRGFYPDEENACWASLWNGENEIAFGLKMLHKNVPGTVMTGSLYLYVEDIDELWGELKDKVEIMFPVENRSYKMREFGIRDCNGYALVLGQDISGETQ